MAPDAEGFLYPRVDIDRCVDCGRCVAVCPGLNSHTGAKRPASPAVHAVWHLDAKIRRQSSSGGAFSAVAESILSLGGVVVGAAFDPAMTVRHVLVEQREDLSRLRGSKYVQSEIDPALYKRIATQLAQGRHVLFSGTPCQVAGLGRFLGDAHPTFYCCDLACMGVPSPGWFRAYLDSLRRRVHAVDAVAFRDKRRGWKRLIMRMRWSDGRVRRVDYRDDVFLAAFHNRYSLRPCCYACRFATPNRVGDLTLADYWGVSGQYPEYDREDKGTSLVLVNSKKGRDLLGVCRSRIFCGDGDLDHAIAGNPVLARPSPRPPERDTFYDDVARMNLRQLQKQYRLRPRRFWRRCLGRLGRLLKGRRATA